MLIKQLTGIWEVQVSGNVAGCRKRDTPLSSGSELLYCHSCYPPLATGIPEFPDQQAVSISTVPAKALWLHCLNVPPEMRLLLVEWLHGLMTPRSEPLFWISKALLFWFFFFFFNLHNRGIFEGKRSKKDLLDYRVDQALGTVFWFKCAFVESWEGILSAGDWSVERPGTGQLNSSLESE